jgi:hypothetical protein
MGKEQGCLKRLGAKECLPHAKVSLFLLGYSTLTKQQKAIIRRRLDALSVPKSI